MTQRQPAACLGHTLACTWIFIAASCSNAGSVPANEPAAEQPAVAALAALEFAATPEQAPPCPDTFVAAQAQQGPRGSFATGAPLEEQHRRDAAQARAILMGIPSCTYPEGRCGPQTRATGCDQAEAVFHCVPIRPLSAECPTQVPKPGTPCEGSGLSCDYPQERLVCHQGKFAAVPDAVPDSGNEFMNCPARM